MDKSEQYIKMCRAADEIQHAWIPDYGDFYGYFDKLKTNNIGTQTEKEFVEYQCNTWLPRQDQLQDMLLNTHTPDFLFSGTHLFMKHDYVCPDDPTCIECRNIGVHRRTTFLTMEQVWLAIVMLELYKKEWDGEKWTQTNQT